MKLHDGFEGFPLANLFEEESCDVVARKLHDLLKHQIIEQFGLSKSLESSRNSTEHHKEPKDKDFVRTLLVGLLPSEGNRVVYSEEVHFCLPKNVCGPNGVLDLLVGQKSLSQLAEGQERFVALICESPPSNFGDLVTGETKSVNTSLVTVLILPRRY